MSLDGYKIRALRLEKGISQEELAFHIDSSSSVICRIENGETTNPRISTVVKLCEFFEVSVESLISTT